MDGQPGAADRRPTKRVPNDSDKPLGDARQVVDGVVGGVLLEV